MLKPEQPVRAISELMDYCAAAYGSQSVFRWREREEIRSITYARFAEEARALAAWFAGETSRNAHIAILGGNSYDWLLGWFSALCAGRVVVPLDPQLPTANLLALLERSGAELLLYDKDFDDVAEAFPRDCLRLEELPAREGADGWPCAARPEDLGAIVFTSGTTGDPKGVMLSQWNFISDALSGTRLLGYGAHETLVALPFYHTFGITPVVLATMYIGSTISICQGVKYFKKDLETFQPQTLGVVPLIGQTIYDQIWDTAEKEGKAKLLRVMLKLSDGLCKVGIDLRRRLFKTVLDALGGRMETMVCGGAPVPPAIVTGFKRFGIDFLPGYGTTECAPGISMNIRENCKAESVGLVMDCNRVRIVDGEIQVKGDNVFMGYYENEEATREAFTEDGWFRTGDLGHIDADGHLYVTGRKKNLIILSNGENVSPEGLEEKLMAIPIIKEALVYESGGEITAELFLDEEAPDAAARLEGEMKALNRGLPAHHRITKTVLRDTEFPKTTIKKIKRK